MGKTVRKSTDGTWLGKSTKLGMLIRSQKKDFFLSVYVEDIELIGKKQNVSPMWKKLMKDVDIEEPTSFLDHVFLGCTRRECKPNEKIIGQYKMFESRISAGATEKLPGWHKHREKLQRGHTTWKDMLENAWNRIANWQTKKTE